MFALGEHAGFPCMGGTRCWIAHSAAEPRNCCNMPQAHWHLATGEVHAVPIYPSGMPQTVLLLHINQHFGPL